MAPYYLEKARFGYRMGPGQLQDHMIHDGLWDIVNDFHMGISNELCSEKYDVSREDQDRYAAESYRRALAAIEERAIQGRDRAGGGPRRKGDPGVRHATSAPGKPLRSPGRK
jgi:acetyl-CoA C-acetyltransferase